MNIFLLTLNLALCAQWYCDKHVVKMILETTQLLCTTYHVLRGLDEEPPIDLYKSVSINHPCAIWARSTLANYKLLAKLGLALCDEYTYRYNKTHKCESMIQSLLEAPPMRLQHDYVTQPAQAMPDQFKGDNVFIAYRKYYQHKLGIISMKWTKRNEPPWLRSRVLFANEELEVQPKPAQVPCLLKILNLKPNDRTIIYFKNLKYKMSNML